MNNRLVRGNLYKLSSLLLLYPIRRYAQEMKDDRSIPDKLRRDIDNLINTFCSRDKLSDIKVSYTKLFVTYYPTTPCPPYIHIYLNLNPVDIEYSLTRLLKNLNLSVREDYKDLKDNYSLLFELLYFSTLLEDRDLGEEIEKEILTKFIFPSIEKFISCIIKKLPLRHSPCYILKGFC